MKKRVIALVLLMAAMSTTQVYASNSIYIATDSGVYRYDTSEDNQNDHNDKYNIDYYFTNDDGSTDTLIYDSTKINETVYTNRFDKEGFNNKEYRFVGWEPSVEKEPIQGMRRIHEVWNSKLSKEEKQKLLYLSEGEEFYLRDRIINGKPMVFIYRSSDNSLVDYLENVENDTIYFRAVVEKI